MSDKPSLYERIIRRLFGNLIDRLVNAAVTVRVDDSPGWDSLSGGGPHDRPWAELHEDLSDALEAWRKNFMVRRIVTLTHSYVVGNGIQITSQRKQVEKFIRRFWDHDQNEMDDRLEPLCDELTRSGELFCILFTNKVDGTSYIRFVPASQIREIKSAENDYETELAYGEIQQHSAQLKWWISPNDPRAFRINQAQPPQDSDIVLGETGALPPVMLHFTVNKPVGATRGEGDLTPVLPWAKRYAEWLKDRVRLNRVRTRQALLDVEIADDAQINSKRQQLRRDDPLDAGIYVHGRGENATLHSLQIRADDASEDGKLLRLAQVTGANLALHYVGEGEAVNYSTAKEMGEPTSRFFSSRQKKLIRFLIKIVTVAYQRYLVVHGREMPVSWSEDLELSASVTEVARADNLALAQAARQIVEALAQMRENGWIDDRTAVRLAFKFAGEVIGEDEINQILETPQEEAAQGTPWPRNGKNAAVTAISRSETF